MSGLLLLLAIFIYLATVSKLTTTLGNVFPYVEWRGTAKVLIFVGLLATPILDEVIGMWQFKALCTANGIESADVSKARGKLVKIRVNYAERQPVRGTIMPIDAEDVLFEDADTGEILIQVKNYIARGGWLMRHTPISMGAPQPIFFGGSTCDVRIEQAIFKANSITFSYK